MKHITAIIIITFFFFNFSYGQEIRVKFKEIKKLIDSNKIKKENILNFKKPLNTFISAGVSFRMGSNYGVVISPVDNTVQFQEKPNLHSGISTGLVWTPFTNYYKSNKDSELQYKKRNNGVSIALLINIFNLSFSGEQVNSTSPINVGFGLGWRDQSSGFLALLTYEFTPLRQPRNYFIDAYKGKNIPLLLSGTQEPVKAININDDALFYTKLYQFIGIKIAYSFGFKKEDEE